MQAFVQKVARYIHQNSSQLVTLGSAKSSWLYLWKEYWFGPIGLDFFQAHYYDWMGANEAPFVPVSSLNLDRPVLVGEFPTKGTSHTISQYLEASWNNGYCGALAWSLNGGDGFSDFPAVATEFQQWLSTHQLLVPWPHRIFLPTLRRQ